MTDQTALAAGPAGAAAAAMWAPLTGGVLVTAIGLAEQRSGWACWLIIALALTLDITIVEMGFGSGCGRRWDWFQDWVIEPSRMRRMSERSPAYPSPASYPEYKPPAPAERARSSLPGSQLRQPLHAGNAACVPRQPRPRNGCCRRSSRFSTKAAR